ncbi:transcription factor GTE1-like [Zingiber officinale]|uniref:transcription factor GTE1-like n=1 Tax=Zingiber officinale TaxID=94328 RepID=UPI001C4BA112|nr:transcription factor GTE1-like [Zingiber officinale]
MVSGTIKSQMEAKDKDGSWYKNVREIYADARLVFTNAMKHNDDQSDIHVMAKSSLENFEEKWLQLLPKVVEEEARQKDEGAQTHSNIRNSRKPAYAKIARETYNELDELNSQLEDLRAMIIEKCRKMTTEEKRKLGVGLSTLSPEDLNRALEIITEDNPSFQATGEVVDLDLDAQSETTLWKLKFFMKRVLENQAKNSVVKANDNLKRKREIICKALVKSAAKKRNK